MQRDELEQTREELKNQRFEFETQNKTLKQQQFVSALYNMLQLPQQIVNDLACDTAVEGYSDTTARNGWTIVVKGRDILRFTFEQLKHKYNSPLDGEKRTTDGMKDDAFVLRPLLQASVQDFEIHRW